MGIINEVIGAIVAEEALDKADPNANLLEKGAAAVAGFEGENVLQNAVEGFFDKKKPADAQDASAASDDAQTS